jgi:hypothetical protein
VYFKVAGSLVEYVKYKVLPFRLTNGLAIY